MSWRVTLDDSEDLLAPGRDPDAPAPAQVPDGSRAARDTSGAEGGALRRYQYRGELGHGGMGDVRLYRDRIIGRDIAKKTLRRSDVGEDAPSYHRFLREARIQGQLQHPAIVPVHELGIDRDGAPYFVMKRVRGVSLREVLSKLADEDAETVQKFTLRKLLSAFDTVCQAVHFAHMRGVLHRDLKPANIMLGDYGEVYVLDWGLAKLRDPQAGGAPGEAVGETSRSDGDDDAGDDGDDNAGDDAGDDANEDAAGDEQGPPRATRVRAQSVTGSASEETRAGTILGTPGYMAPEQFSGFVARVDERSDVYALGMILFEILTLDKFHHGDSIEDLRWSTLHEGVIRARERCPEQDIPPELDAICARATAYEPEQRFADVGELARALASYLDGDRDLARRKQLADIRAAEAKTALAKSRATGESGAESDSEGSLSASADMDRADDGADEAVWRGRAMRAVTAALGLYPDHREAREVLLHMLTTPPRTVPPEAQAEMAASERHKHRRAALMATLVYLGFALYIPFPIWMGVRSPFAFALLAACIATCALWSYYLYRNPPGDSGVPIGHLTMATITVMVSAAMAGPFILVPMLALANTMVYIASTGRRRRWLIVVAGCLAIALPWLLQALSWLPASMHFYDGGIAIAPVMFELPATATNTFLLLSNLMILLTGALYVSRLRDSFTDAERALQLQAWQLRQIVPTTEAER